MGVSVFCGTLKTWKDRSRRDDLDEMIEVTYHVRDWCPVFLCERFPIPHYRSVSALFETINKKFHSPSSPDTGLVGGV